MIPAAALGLGWEGAPFLDARETCSIEGGYGPLVLERPALTDAQFADVPIQMPPMPSQRRDSYPGYAAELPAIDIFGPSLWSRIRSRFSKWAGR